MNEIERRIRWIEGRLAALGKPEHCATDRIGQPRSISPDAKVKEAKQLVEKIYEAQKLIDTIEDPTAKYVYQGYLDEAEQIRREIISPAILVIEECDI